MTSPSASAIEPPPATGAKAAPTRSDAPTDADATGIIDLTDAAPSASAPNSTTSPSPDLSAPPPFRHRNCLDGVRGIAVIVVVLYHLDLPWMSGGYLGVDVFFVLSGFLITTLLIREWTEHGRIDLKRFWIRRARRLLPAMLVVLAGVAVFAVLFAQPEQLGDIRAQGLASLFYVTNWARVFDQTSYFDAFAAKSPLEHYWSLAIEEQFYVVWPLITAALFTWRARAAGTLDRVRRYDVPMWLVGVLGAAASAGLMAALYSPDNTSLYFRTDTRLQGLLIGVALAALFDGFGRRIMSKPPAWLVPVGWAAGAVFLLATVTDVIPALLYQGGFLMIAALTGMVILAAMAVERSSLDRALSIRPLRFFGRISYGLYLWHWPIILVLTPERTGLSMPVLNVARFGLSVGFAVLSLLLLEIPIRERRLPVRFELVSIGVVPIMLVIAFLVTTTGAGPTLEEAYADDQGTAAPVATVEPVEPPAALSTLVLGDELALALPAQWGQPDGDDPTSGTLTLAGTGCDDATKLCDDWRQRWQARVDQVDPDVVMVAIRSWEAFDDTDTQLNVFDSAETERAYTDGMGRLVNELGAGPTDEGGRTVVILTSPPINTPSSFDAFAVERTLGAAQQVATRSNGAVEHVTLEGLWCGQTLCVDRARLNPAEGEFALVSPNPEAFGSALAGVSRRAVRGHLTQEAAGDQLKVLLLGDSVAWSIGSNFLGDGTDARNAPVLLWNQAEFSCYPDPAPGNRITLPEDVLTECPDWAERWPTYIKEFGPDIVLVPVSQWMILDREVDDRVIPFDSDEMRERIRNLYSQTVDVLSEDGSLIVLTTVIPNVESVNAGSLEQDLEETQRRELALNNIIVELVESRSEDVALIDLAGWLCDGAECQEEINGIRLRPDGGHFTPQSSPLAGAFLSGELERIAAERGLTPEAATDVATAGPTADAAAPVASTAGG